MESMAKAKHYVGIDISKDYFDVALPQQEKYRHLKLSNSLKGFGKLLEALQGLQACCVMEASGPYYLQLATYLHAKGIEVSVVNPLSIRRFCQMRLTRAKTDKAKTDKKDAQMIARYGLSEQPALWVPEAGHLLELRQLQMVAESLEKTLHQYRRQLEALAAAPQVNRQARKSLEQSLHYIEKQVEKIEAQMLLLIKQHHQELFEQVTSIPGLGKKSALLLVVITGGFTRFAHYKQLVSYLGLSPRIYESGTSVRGRSRICKMGMSRVRAVRVLLVGHQGQPGLPGALRAAPGQGEGQAPGFDCGGKQAPAPGLCRGD
ncbi:IS110 family transposase [Pontibacter sp. HSC-14F20]|uniref:IS110 family transposase n=1 Tax=Pontibacter sp. HSC-14F20 TaxID=2864136 RepID=UPI002106032E|nr:IS110 family transposase [Pontibacter sp. HSC-14F20]